PDCDHYGARGAGNLSACGLFGKYHHLRLLSCHTGKARFSESKGTAFFRSRLPTEKALSVLQHLAEGSGARQTARLTGVHRDSVTRLARLAGEYARDAHEELGAFSPRDP